MVPCEAIVYAQVVESELISRWNVLHPLSLCGDDSGDVDDALKVDAKSNSSSSLALHDLQLSQFKPEWFKPVTEPLEVFRFVLGSSFLAIGKV